MIIYQKYISREDLRANPKAIYLFGDNDARLGYAGQAKEMRGEPNAIGIRTKKIPGSNVLDYYSDEEYRQNQKKIDEDFGRVDEALSRGAIAVIPLDGLGTGYAQLADRAPETYNYILYWISRLVSRHGSTYGI